MRNNFVTLVILKWNLEVKRGAAEAASTGLYCFLFYGLIHFFPFQNNSFSGLINKIEKGGKPLLNSFPFLNSEANKMGSATKEPIT